MRRWTVLVAPCGHLIKWKHPKLDTGFPAHPGWCMCQGKSAFLSRSMYVIPNQFLVEQGNG